MFDFGKFFKEKFKIKEKPAEEVHHRQAKVNYTPLKSGELPASLTVVSTGLNLVCPVPTNKINLNG